MTAAINSTEVSDAVRRIVERSARPEEWAVAPRSEYLVSSQIAIRDLFERWETRMRIFGARSDMLDQRLSTLGINREEALDRLSARRIPPDSELPSWAQLLAEVLSPASFQSMHGATNQLPRAQPFRIDTQVPLYRPLFPDVLRPFLTAAIRRIDNSAEWREVGVLPSVERNIVEYLLSELSQISARVISYEVKRRSKAGELTGPDATARYRFFVHDILGTPEGLLKLFEQYPVLARLLAVRTEQVITAILRLLRRVNVDRTELAARFGKSSCLGKLAALDLGLSDLHAGDSVTAITFEDATKIVLKPRSLAVDVAFQRLAAWFNSQNAEAELYELALFDRGDYGWSEFVCERDCSNIQEAARFYERQGIYLALFYFLCGVDFHEENSMPCGEYPVPIDMEGLLSISDHVGSESVRRLPRAMRPLSFSVLNTGMTPFWRWGDDDHEPYCLSGIHGAREGEDFGRYAIWEGLDTDRLRPIWVHLRQHFDKNLPRLDGKRVPAVHFIDRVLAGFTSAYRTIVANRDQLKGEGGALLEFADIGNRVFIRDTRDYDEVLKWSVLPDHLTSGAAHDVALERICTIPLAGKDAIDLKVLWEEEKARLWERNIPVFRGRPADTVARRPDHEAIARTDRSPLQQMRQRVNDASDADLAWQRELIRSAFAIALEPRTTEKNPLSTESDRLKERAVSQAASIAAALHRVALRHDEGKSWLMLVRPSREAPALVGLTHPEPWLYCGASGTALFLANFAAITGDEQARETALDALRYTESVTNEVLARRLALDANPLGFAGVFSTAYSVVECGRLLGRKDLIDSAHYTVSGLLPLITDHLPKSPDLISGAAGAILTLLHVFRYKRDERLIDAANVFADAILTHRAGDEGQYGGWDVPNYQTPPSGMGHGAAGISYALASLAGLTGSTSLLEIAAAGMEFEYRRLREWTEKEDAVVGWCTGAPGVGLAGLAFLDFLPHHDNTRSLVEAAISVTRRHVGSGSHNLCCGEAARIVFLHEAGRRLGRAELCDDAWSGARHLLDFYSQRGFWQLQQVCSRFAQPDLMGGSPGIGLALLSLADPSSTSKVLLVA